MFRRLAMANFDSLTRETAVHPAMLVMLDNRSNKVETPQENFSRELMELYTWDRSLLRERRGKL